MVGIIGKTDARALARTLALLGVLGCGGGGEAVPQAPPSIEPVVEATPAPTPEPEPKPAPEVLIEDAPEELTAVVAARPQSEALRAAVAGITKAERNRANPFKGKASEAGKIDYDLLCATCHGATAKGGGPASVMLGGTATNLLESAEGESLSDGERFMLTRDGIAGTHMQPFGLARSDAQLWKIQAHIDSLR